MRRLIALVAAISILATAGCGQSAPAVPRATVLFHYGEQCYVNGTGRAPEGMRSCTPTEVAAGRPDGEWDAQGHFQYTPKGSQS